MITLTNPKTNEVVIDFQLIYDADSALHLDFYADGLIEEAHQLFHQYSPFQKINYGFLSCSIPDYEQYENHFDTSMKNHFFLSTAACAMVSTIKPVHELCRKIEKQKRENVFEFSYYKELYQRVVNMMAYKRFSDRCETLFEKPFDIRVPSYLMRLLIALERLDIHSSDEVTNFIERYGYLYDFYIKESRLETPEGVNKYVKTVKPTNPRSYVKMDNSKRSFECILYKYVSWYEEMRHIYQLRALRNFRHFFQYHHLDIHETSWKDLLEKEENTCSFH